jgi:hypothetical protein
MVDPPGREMQMFSHATAIMVLAVPASVVANTVALVRPGRLPTRLLVLLWALASALLIVSMAMTTLFAWIAMPPMLWSPLLILRRWSQALAARPDRT